MPYIKQEDRKRLTLNGKWNSSPIKTAGELNFLLTILFLGNFWNNADELETAVRHRVFVFFEATEKKYQNYNDVGGALDYCRREFVRRFYDDHPRAEDVVNAVSTVANDFYDRYAAPYEDKKIKENGDVT